MTVADGFLPLIALCGAFLLVSPWLDPESDVVRRAWSWLSTLLALRYLTWRMLVAFPSPEPTLRYAYQLFCLIVELAFYYLVLKIRWGGIQRTNRRPEADSHEGWWRTSPKPPLVDVFIPTYNESLGVLERTVVGAERLDYPRVRVWILDDGKRDWLAAWAHERGLEYLRRPTNLHYKAGNLNHALKHVLALAEPPDFIAVIDADFIVKPRFVRRTLALMHDPAVAVVQTPQVFFNPDPFQHALSSRSACPDEQRHFFDYTLPNLDRNGWATCSGTSFLVRVSALESIGGFPTESVSEDTLMSIKLLDRGLKTVYLDEPLSCGLNPDGMKEFLTQRARWALGQVEIARGAWGPLARGRGLGRWVAFARHTWSWSFFCVYGLLTAAMSIVFWVTGVYAVQMDIGDLLFYAGPLWCEGFILAWLSRGRYLPLAREAMEIVTGFAVLPATIKAVRRGGDGRFVVTQKGVQRGGVVLHWSLLRWLLPLLALQVLGVVLGFGDPSVTQSPLFGVGLFDAVKTIITLSFAILPCVELPKYRTDERYGTSESAVLEIERKVVTVRLLDLSLGGAAAQVECELEVGVFVHLELEHVGRVRARVVRRLRKQAYGLSFELGARQKDDLIAKIYCTDDYVKLPRQWTFGGCMAAMARRVFLGGRSLRSA